MSNLDRWNRARFTRSTQINQWSAKIIANRSRYEAGTIMGVRTDEMMQAAYDAVTWPDP